MKHLIINNVGPIQEIDLHLKRYNFIIGQQSSGKSTIAKILSTCSWIEKEAATTLNAQVVADADAFCRLVSDFHKTQKYFCDKSKVYYETDAIIIDYQHPHFQITLKPGINYHRQKISYIPAERNVVTLQELQGYEFGQTNLRSFLSDWFSARESFTADNKTDILGLGVRYFYDKNEQKFKDQIEHTNGSTYQIPLASASSGLQAVIPLLVMLRYYTSEYFERPDRKTAIEVDDKVANMKRQLTKDMVLSVLYPNFDDSHWNELVNQVNEKVRNADTEVAEIVNNYNSAVKQLATPSSSFFIVEEPEANLFPATQRRLLMAMLQMCQTVNRSHEFTITTHSPYILATLNNLILAGQLAANGQTERLQQVMGENSCTMLPDTYAAYFIDGGRTTSIVDPETGLIDSELMDGASHQIEAQFNKLLGYDD